MNSREKLWNDIAKAYIDHLNPCGQAVDFKLLFLIQDYILTLGAVDIIIDVGCGNGVITDIAQKMLIQNNGNRIKFVGVDISKEMIKLAKSNYGEREDLTFYHIKETFEGIEDESIDVAMANWVYITCDSFDTMRHSFKEVYRVLKPGGRFYFSAHNLENEAIGMPFSTYAVGVQEKEYKTGDTIMVVFYEWNQRPKPNELKNWYDGQNPKGTLVFPDSVYFPEDYGSLAREVGFDASYEKVWLKEREIHIVKRIFGERTPDFTIEQQISPAIIFILYKPV